ncbi:MAG: 1-deoxy-D-xylulose-5-phosphate reductoisomerase [Spirochaetaceae bacterium]|jgi:1-deoxy-D-xylulose-5-phosphate reductoisomerase|nr:1-deoxy-D-xylulose-5-phosphate reductoisomerase [Spirochaetaceae bacterium]
MKKRVAVLGATGSIGKSVIDVLRAGRDYFEPVLFSCHRDAAPLIALKKEFPAALLALSGAETAPEGVYAGKAGLLHAAAVCGADIAVNGISGAAGLPPSLAALEAGADLALANKETVVMAAPLVFETARRRGKRIIPVDSEHAAVFNLIEAHGRETVAEIILTASGGPFRKTAPEALARIRPVDALRHPTWSMGPKITIDSATMANKGLEVIEAAFLFGAAREEISVVVHPASVVHALVRLKSGALYAELSRPDMRLPIHHALHYPAHVPAAFGRLELGGPSFDLLSLEFEKPDTAKFPLLPLAFEAVAHGGAWPILYNAANEAAVAAFLAEKIGFLDISRVVEYVLNHSEYAASAVSPGDFTGDGALSLILAIDRRGREEAEAFMGRM